MKLILKETPERVELIRAMGDRDPAKNRPAREMFAAFIGPVIQQVLMQVGTASAIFADAPYDEDEAPSYPLDLWYDEGVDFINVWYQTAAGGLPANHLEGLKELKFQTYRLDCAMSLSEKYARRARLNVVTKGIQRMVQQVLYKQELNAWAVVLKALAEANTNSLVHLIGANTADVFQLHDLNSLLTRARRINTAWSGGTPEVDIRGLTDLFVSPEVKAQIRAFAYQPMNTRTVDGSAGTPAGSSTAMPLPDDIRSAIYRSAGTEEIYNVSIHEMLELGDGQRYNTLFDNFYSGTPTFATATDDLVVGVDMSREALIRPVERRGSSTFTVLPDDQYVSRQEKLGFYGFLEEGRICVDARVLTGVIV